MRRLAPVVLVFAISTAIGAERPTHCTDTAKTQRALTQCAGNEFRAAEGEMLRLVQTLHETHARDPLFLKRLDDSQRAWLKYRTAQLAMRFPHADAPNYYGSVLPMCEGSYLAQLTQQRIATLREWIDGTAGGDVCAGSIADLNGPDHNR
jgi:uncharacterized protein YecT (DUF1311 family)